MEQSLLTIITSWFENNGRPLEKAMVSYLSQPTTKASAIRELMAYQHDQGGFGRGLEPDCLNPEPSPIQTWFATDYVRQLGLNSDHIVVKGMLDYLDQTIAEDGMFDSVIPTNNDHPHAPWWHDRVTNRRWGYNPTASLLGFMNHYRPSPQTKGHIEKALQVFLSYETYDMHELRCFVDLHDDLLESQDDFALFADFQKQLIKALLANPGNDPKLWTSGYGPRPAMYCSRPGMLGCRVLKEGLAFEKAMAAAAIRTQGSPDINWSWGQYEKEFQESRKAWQGILMMNAYVMFSSAEES